MAYSSPIYKSGSRAPKGQQEAKKGDTRTMDKEIQDGPDTIEFKGEYESTGIEGRDEEDPDKISDKDKAEMGEDLKQYDKGGRKGPAPSFKDSPKKEDRQKEGDYYEIWRRKKRKEVPTS